MHGCFSLLSQFVKFVKKKYATFCFFLIYQDDLSLAVKVNYYTRKISISTRSVGQSVLI